MLRILLLGTGIFAVILGFQLFGITEVTVNPAVAEKMKISSKLLVADYFPYSLIGAGAVMFYYGYHMQRG